MSDKDAATAAAEAAARELVKVAYGDLLQPSAREIGAEFHEFVRAIMVAGRGFGYLIRETYAPFVLKALAQVPKDQRVLPAPSVLGPILEGVTYQEVGSELADMFEALLVSSMHAEKAPLVHPSFPGLINRLSRDEAIIIRHLKNQPIKLLNKVYSSDADEILVLDEVKGIEFPDNSRFYNRHLLNLGLTYLSGDPIPERTFIDAVEFYNYEIRLSIIGRALTEACSRAS